MSITIIFCKTNFENVKTSVKRSCEQHACTMFSEILFSDRLQTVLDNVFISYDDMLNVSYIDKQSTKTHNSKDDY